MPSWLPSWPYRPQETGYWSPVTSTINWCEEDYYITTYSAEIVNQFTNLIYMYLAYKGIHNCIKQGHEPIFAVTYIGYLIIGTGSFFFHMTLKYPWQLVDELGMIYSTCIMFYATFAYKKSFRYSFFMATALLSLSLFITIYYHYLQDPTFHQVTYAILTAIVLFRSMYMMEVNIRPRWKAKEEEERQLLADAPIANGKTPEEKAERIRVDHRDVLILKTMWNMIAYGLSVFLGGFGIWCLDNIFCNQFRSWRHAIGLPWGVVLEGHGWWHLMTGIGAYFYIVWGIWLRHCLDGKQDDYDLYWPRFFTSFPVVMKRKNLHGASGMIFANGATKKTR